MDNKDIEIISILKQNSRETIKEIARKTKLRPSTVHQRLKKLSASGAIEKFTVKLNDKLAGENFIVLVLVKGSTAEYIDKGAINDPHIKEIFGVTGEHDLLIKMKFGSIDEFNKFILKFRNRKGIQSTITMVATAVLKEEI